MSFRSAREARERFLQIARRAEESAPLFWRVLKNAGANPACAPTVEHAAPTVCSCPPRAWMIATQLGHNFKTRPNADFQASTSSVRELGWYSTMWPAIALAATV